MTTTIEQPKAQEFVRLVNAGIECWRQAGEIIVELLDADRDAGLRICEDHPEITPDIILRFEQIGRKQLCPKLLLSDTPGTRRLMTLPLSVQEKYADEPVELLVVKGDATDTLNVPIKNLTASQAAQAFGAQGPRSLAEQRAYMFDRAAKSAPKAAALPFEIDGDSVTFRAACKLTYHELMELAARVRRSMKRRK